MSYVVLARRTRSRHFDEVVGQEHVARTLCNAIEQDRVAHAFLFCGPRGVGKTSTARILAKALNCAEGPTTRPCYSCASCQEISEGSSMDVFEIDGASNRGVNEIRELREGVRYAPSRDRYKIYIIDEVHMLTTEAFNALLKTLEEPPEHVKFIFATTEPQKIPVTILSRCQRFDFKRIPTRTIAEHLANVTRNEGIEAEPGGLTLIARQADGCMRDALSLTDQVISFCDGSISEQQVAQVLGVAGRDVLFRLTGALLRRQVEEALRVLDEVNSAGFDLMHFISAFVEHLRDMTVIQVSEEVEGLVELTAAELEQARHQLAHIDISVLNRMFNITIQAAETMSRSAYPKLVFEMTLVKLAAIEPLMPIEMLLKRLEAMESGVLLGPPPGGGSAPPTSPGPGSGAGGPGGAASGGGSEQRTSPRPAATTSPPTNGATVIPMAPVGLPPRPEKGDIPLTAGSPGARNNDASNGHLRLVPPGTVDRPAEPIPLKRDAPPEPISSSPEPSATASSPTASPAGVAQDNPAQPGEPEAPPEAAPDEVRLDADVPGAQHNAPEGHRAPQRVRLGAGEVMPEEDAREVWRAVVERLKADGRRVQASVYEQARILEVREGSFRLGFDPGLDVIAQKHVALVEETATALLGGGQTSWQIQLSFEAAAAPDAAAGARRSLAQEQDELHRARLERARPARGPPGAGPRGDREPRPRRPGHLDLLPGQVLGRPR